jgi:hypothetical protein
VEKDRGKLLIKIIYISSLCPGRPVCGLRYLLYSDILNKKKQKENRIEERTVLNANPFSILN